MKIYSLLKDGELILKDTRVNIASFLDCSESNVWLAERNKKKINGYDLRVEDGMIEKPDEKPHLKQGWLRLQSVLKEKNITFDKYCRHSSVNPVRLEELSCGTLDLTLGEYLSIAKDLGVTACYLLTGSEYEGDAYGQNDDY